MFTAAMFCGLVVVGCSDDPAAAPVPAPASVVLSTTEATLSSIGDTVRVNAMVRDANGLALSTAVAWMSGNPSVVTVSGAGTIRAVGNGSTTVSAKAGPATATIMVTVDQQPAEVSLTPSSITLTALGATAALAAAVRDAGGTAIEQPRLTWATSDAAVATVSATGTVTAVGDGSATITAMSGSASVTAIVTVFTSGGLLYRWTFSEEGGRGTVFRDDVRGAQATIVGNGALPASAVSGQVTLTGGSRDAADYVALPPGLLSDRTDATIEVWATLHSLKKWSRVLDVGSSPANNLFIAWSQDANASADRTAFTVNGIETGIDNAMAPFTMDIQHHIVLTIDESAGTGGSARVSLYLDGRPRGSFDSAYRLRDLIDEHFWLGRSHYADETANASYDELSIYDRAHGAAAVQQLFLRGPVRSGPPTSLRIVPPPGMRDTIRGVGVDFQLRAVGRDQLGREFPVAGVRWSSSDPSVATVDSTGTVRAHAVGRAEIEAAVAGSTARWSAEALRMRRIEVDPYLATPIAGALWDVPVVLIEYLPSADGFSLDVAKAPDFWWLNPMSLDSVEALVLTIARRRKMMVEEGSRFRGYRDPAALPSLGYRVVDHIVVYDQIPPHPTKRAAHIAGQPRFENWHAVFEDLDLRAVMTRHGARELWVAWSGLDAGFPAYDPAIHRPEDFRTGWESNMSSPTTGDISNSDRDPADAPVLEHTYIIYGISIRRTQAEAVHNVGHQLESMLSHVAARQDGNDRLFWRDFVGFNTQGQFIPGRSGWTHMPPNTAGDYDYLNPTLVESDIEDWRVDNQGRKKLVNVDTWGELVYPWPGEADFHQRVESQWYTYWFQSFPGRDNTIPHGNRWMTNWWRFVADWDAAIRSGLGLHSSMRAATAGEGSYRFAAPRAGAANASHALHPRAPTRR